jgi:hypothetical protein
MARIASMKMIQKAKQDRVMQVQASGRQSRSRRAVVRRGRWLSNVIEWVSCMAGSKKLAQPHL